MCEYCNGKLVRELNMSKPLFAGYCETVDMTIFLNIQNKEIQIYNDESADYTYVPINYCPMCR